MRQTDNAALVLVSTIVCASIVYALMAFSSMSYATPVDYQSIQQSALQQGQQAFSPTDYCNGDSVCEQSITNPAAKQYYSNGTHANGQADLDEQLTNAGDAAAKAQGIKADVKWRQSQPKEPIDLFSPEMLALSDYTKNAATLANGVSDKYHDCKGGVAYTYPTRSATCIIPTHAPIACTLKRVVAGHVPQQHENTLTGNMRDAGSLAGIVTYPLPKSTLKLLTITVKTPAFFSGYQHIYLTLDGHYLGELTGVKSGETCRDSDHFINRYCTSHYQNHATKTFTINRHINNPNIALHYATCRAHCNGRWITKPSGTQHITVKWETDPPIMRWENTCDTAQLQAQSCHLVNSHCSQGASTRTIEGFPVQQSCWQQQQQWQCSAPDTCRSLPHKTIDMAHWNTGDTSCEPSQSQCVQTLNSVCIKESKTYTCSTKVKSSEPLICGNAGTIECTGGASDKNNPRCQNTRYQSPVSLGDVMLKLAVQKAMLDAFDAKKLRFFTGKAMSCNVGALGSFNCCKDSGWLGSIGFHQCDTQAADLIIAKRKHLALKVGEYCAERVLGACIRKKERYCVYTGKMGKITRQASITQLGKNLGSAKNPDCSGFTQAQFSQIDFSHIDFSDMIGDLTPPVTPSFSVTDFKDKAKQGNHGDNRCDPNTYPYSQFPDLIKRDCP